LSVLRLDCCLLSDREVVMTLTQHEFTALCASHGFGAHVGVLRP
jgi:hypothetical protein